MSKLNLPPNSCIPSKAKMTMKRKSKSNKLAIERIEFNSDATRLRNADQYLGGEKIIANVSDKKSLNRKCWENSSLSIVNNYQYTSITPLHRNHT